MVKYVESEGEWMALMNEEKLVVVDFTASWWVDSTCIGQKSKIVTSCRALSHFTLFLYYYDTLIYKYSQVRTLPNGSTPLRKNVRRIRR